MTAMRILLVAALLAAQAAAGAAVEPRDRQLRVELQEVEKAIDRRFQDLRDEAPMALLGATRGAYLEGYGAIFTLQINLVPVAGLSPFRQSYGDEERRQLNVRKRQRLETLELKAREILVEESGRLESLPAGETVALAVSLFHFNWEDLTLLPSQMVMAAAKDLLDRARSGALPPGGLRQALAVRFF